VIISKIFGGLGNQMFQYAAGRALAMRKGVEHRLDISAYEHYQMHQGFELNSVFKADVRIATQVDIDRIIGIQSSPILQRLLSRSIFSSFRKPSLVFEPGFNYWDGMNRIEDDTFISGYWQSPKYFQDVISTIRSDFEFKLPMNFENSTLANRICSLESVSLHIRRGDYVTNSGANKQHGLCSLDYYHSAIDLISRREIEPYFFVFSDDPAWVRQNLLVDHPCCFVEHNSGDQSHNDMRLMSLCRHHIIANSSFSWWGAWLGSNSDNITIAPAKWFASGMDVRDLYPDNWVLM
jgi:hypothetical protein